MTGSPFTCFVPWTDKENEGRIKSSLFRIASIFGIAENHVPCCSSLLQDITEKGKETKRNVLYNNKKTFAYDTLFFAIGSWRITFSATTPPPMGEKKSASRAAAGGGMIPWINFVSGPGLWNETKSKKNEDTG